jgi:hypothetical protein
VSFDIRRASKQDLDALNERARQWRESQNAESEGVTGQLEGSCDETQQAVPVQAELALE